MNDIVGLWLTGCRFMLRSLSSFADMVVLSALSRDKRMWAEAAKTQWGYPCDMLIELR